MGNMKQHTIQLCVGGLIICLAGCEPRPPAEGSDAVVARVNETRLTIGDLESDLQTALLPIATAQMKQNWVKKWVFPFLRIMLIHCFLNIKVNYLVPSVIFLFFHYIKFFP